MGCRQTKGDSAEKEDTFDPLQDNGVTPLPKVDSRLPLDTRQMFKLKQSWKGIKRKIEETGVEMFVRLFKSSASIMAVFARFVSTESEDELRQNEQLEQHATLVMSTMDEAITHMDNYDYITDFLHKTGGTHQRFDSFKVDYFVKIREPFLEAVKITLGDRYTDYMKNVYEITINFILKGLENGYLDNNHPTEHTIIVTYHPTEQPEVTKLDNCNVQNDDGTNTEQAKT